MLYDELGELPPEKPAPNDIEKMRAELLGRYGPTERPEEFDDGLSLLGQNPYMQEVGMLKVPKFNPARRTMGLDLSRAKVPAPVSNAILPIQPEPVQSISPLETLAQMPMSRRKALQIPINAAISHVGKGLVGDLIAPVIESAVTPTLPEIPVISSQELSLGNIIKDDVINAASTAMGELDGAPEEVFSFYGDIKKYLENVLPSKTLKRLDRLDDIIQTEYYNYLDSDGEEEISNRYHNSVEKMIDIIDENKDSIPLEAFVSKSELGHYMRDSRLDSYDLRTNQGLKDFYGVEYSLEQIKDFMKKNDLYPEEGQEE